MAEADSNENREPVDDRGMELVTTLAFITAATDLIVALERFGALVEHLYPHLKAILPHEYPPDPDTSAEQPPVGPT